MQEAAVANTKTAMVAEPQIHGAQLPLAFVEPGRVVHVIKVRGRGELHHHLENLGFIEGTDVSVVTENAGNLIVEVRGTQVALDKQVALKIITSS